MAGIYLNGIISLISFPNFVIMSTSVSLENSPYWSIRMIMLLINRAQNLHPNTTDAWFLLPLPITSKLTEDEDNENLPFITSLLTNDSDIITMGEFSANLYAQKKERLVLKNTYRALLQS